MADANNESDINNRYTSNLGKNNENQWLIKNRELESLVQQLEIQLENTKMKLQCGVGVIEK